MVRKLKDEILQERRLQARTLQERRLQSHGVIWVAQWCTSHTTPTSPTRGPSVSRTTNRSGKTKDFLFVKYFWSREPTNNNNAHSGQVLIYHGTYRQYQIQCFKNKRAYRSLKLSILILFLFTFLRQMYCLMLKWN